MSHNFKQEPYTGMVSDMKDSPWLASEDLLGFDEVSVVISGVFKNSDVPMDGGRKEPILYSVSFEGKDKQMILNATNRKSLSSAFGASTKDWVGKTIKLYVLDGIRKPGGERGETTTGLRIKASKPNPFKPAADEVTTDES